jgi:hypothetical protein
MRASTKKEIAQIKGEKAARAGLGESACPYAEGTAANPDRLNLRFNWMLGYTRVVRTQGR